MWKQATGQALNTYGVGAQPMVPLEYLVKAGVKVRIVRQCAGDVVITGPCAMHFVYSAPGQTKVARYVCVD